MIHEIEEVMAEVKRKVILETGAPVEPLILFYKKHRSDGESFTMQWFEKDFGSEMSISERETLEMFIELAQRALEGRLERRMNISAEPIELKFCKI